MKSILFITQEIFCGEVINLLINNKLKSLLMTLRRLMEQYCDGGWMLTCILKNRANNLQFPQILETFLLQAMVKQLYHISATLPSCLYQVIVNSGGLLGISNWNLSLIYRDRLFSFYSPGPVIFSTAQLLLTPFPQVQVYTQGLNSQLLLISLSHT